MDISALANDESAKKFAQSRCGEYADDIFQDALLVMLELPKDKADKIESDNATPYYFRQVISNLSNRMFRANEIADSKLITGIDILNDIEDISSYNPSVPIQITERLKELHWYERDLFLLYCELGSVRKVEKRTRINYVSVYRTIKKVQDELRPILNCHI